MDIIAQAPKMSVDFYHYDDETSPEDCVKYITFSSDNRFLISCDMRQGIRDLAGSFSLTLFPGTVLGNELHDRTYEGSVDIDEATGAVTDNTKVVKKKPEWSYVKGAWGEIARTHETPLFDIIKIFDIVHIQENGRLVFTGVVRSKKYVAQFGDSGANRRIQISGCGIAGLLKEFKVNMDERVRIVTGNLAEHESTAKDFTDKLGAPLDRPPPDNKLTVKALILALWELVDKISTQYHNLGVPTIEKMIACFMGSVDEIFEVQEGLAFAYPVGNVWGANDSSDFMSLISAILPDQVYEKFAYLDETSGRVKVKIREMPFDYATWGELNGKTFEERDILASHDRDTFIQNGKVFGSLYKGALGIPAVALKSFDVEQNDNEVYTVFFSYCRGMAIDRTKGLMLSLASAKEGSPAPMAGLAWCDPGAYPGKYDRYGYRLMQVDFIGFNEHGSSGGSDITGPYLQTMNERLRDWYSDLERMYKGSITLSSIVGYRSPIHGQKISFLGGEFYVTGKSYRFGFGSNPEITLSVERGGVYEWKYYEWERERTAGVDYIAHTVAAGETIEDVAEKYYGSKDKWKKIVEDNDQLNGRGRQYIVVKNDTLSEIAKKVYGITNWKNLLPLEKSGIFEVREGKRVPEPSGAYWDVWKKRLRLTKDEATAWEESTGKEVKDWPGDSQYYRDPNPNMEVRIPPDMIKADESPVIYEGDRLELAGNGPEDKPCLRTGEVIEIEVQNPPPKKEHGYRRVFSELQEVTRRYYPQGNKKE